MADNTTFTPGTGATLSLDDIGGVLVQRVKIQTGADGEATDVSTANPVPISDAGGSITVDGPLTQAQLIAQDIKVTMDGEAVKPVAGDGNPSEFSMAVVGAHSSGTDISSAVTLTKPEGATGLLIQAVTKDACFTLDGTDPTASKGFVIYAGQAPCLVPVPGTAVEIIQTAATCRLEYQWVK